MTETVDFQEVRHVRELNLRLAQENEALRKENQTSRARAEFLETMGPRQALSFLAKQIHLIARSKGWHEGPLSLPEQIALMHSELSEALEEYRKPVRSDYPSYLDAAHSPDKPSGILIELADCVIRIMDVCEAHGWDLGEAILQKMEYNKQRPYRHRGKRV